MIKKNKVGDYVVTCDKCEYSDGKFHYDFRKTQNEYSNRGWFISTNGQVFCPRCKGNR